MAAQAGERRLRALYPEPGHRQWVAPPPAHLKCSVCEEPFGRAVQAQPVALPCGHTFCRGCVTSWFTAPGKLCPAGRCPASKGVKPASLATNFALQDAVELLPIFCRFGLLETREGEWEADPQGCPAQLPAGEAAAHEAACGFELLRCSFAGCGAELRRSQMDAHDASEALRHARGEREERLAGEKVLAALEVSSAARFAALEASSASRIAALEASSSARFAALEVALAASRRQGGGAALQPVRAGRGVWTLLRTLEGHTDHVWGCAFHPDGSLVASASFDRTVKLWNSATGECIRTLEGHTDQVAACACSPDGATIISGSRDKSLKLWRTATGECLRTLEGHSYIVSCCAFSPDGQQILSGGFDKTLMLWRASTGECLHTLEGHAYPVMSCKFSPDGALILSAGWDGTLKLWRSGTGECVCTLVGHTFGVYCCCFSPDGALILSGGVEKSLKLWRTDTGECLQTLAGHTDQIRSCAISRDGRMIASASRDKTVKIWAKQ